MEKAKRPISPNALEACLKNNWTPLVGPAPFDFAQGRLIEGGMI
jgi:hypothetical protein